MKIYFYIAFQLLLGVLFVVRSNAQGNIIPNGVTYDGLVFDSYSFSVIYNPNNSNYSTGFSFTPSAVFTPPGQAFDTNAFYFDSIANVGVRVFLATANLAITTNALLSGSFTELHATGTPNYVFPSGSPFYLALYTGNVRFAPTDGVYDNPILGWAELVNNQGVIQMLGGATEYGGLGIYVGTSTIIQPAPEPSALALAALGGLTLGLRRWRK